MSPLASAARRLDSATFRLRFTRNSKGLFASSGTFCSVSLSGMAAIPVEGSINDIQLLLPRQPDEVDGVTRDADGQVRILLWMVHGVQKRIAIQHVDVHVVTGGAEKCVEHAREIRDSVLGHPAEPLRH